MANFNSTALNLKKIIIPIIMIIIFLFAMVGQIVLLSYLLVPVRMEGQTSSTSQYHRMLSLPKNTVEVVAFSTSRGLHGLNGKKISKNIGKYFYTMSNDYQPFTEANFFIRELYERQNPEYVFIEVTSQRLYAKTAITGKYLDNVAPSKNKYDFIKRINRVKKSTKDKEFSLITEMFPVFKHIKNLGNINTIQKNISNKKSGYYDFGIVDKSNYDFGSIDNYGYIGDNRSMRHKNNGNYSVSTRYVPEGTFHNPKYFDKVQMESLIDMIKFAKSKGANVVLYSEPSAYSMMIQYPGYQDFINYAIDLAARYDVEYYDFSLLKDSKFPRQGRDFYRDYWHLNNKGANAFALVFSDFFNDVICGLNDKNEYLLNNVDEIFADANYIFEVRNSIDKDLGFLRANVKKADLIKDEDVMYRYQFRYYEQDETLDEIYIHDDWTNNNYLLLEDFYRKINDTYNNLKEGDFRIFTFVRKKDDAEKSFRQYAFTDIRVEAGEIDKWIITEQS